MKIGLHYENKDTGEVFQCINFTRSYYVFKNYKDEIIEIPKPNNSFKRVSGKKVSEFQLKNLNYTLETT